METSSLYADTGILLCAVVKEYHSPESKTPGPEPRVFRADEYSTWKNHRSNCRPIVEDLFKHLREFDMFVAHNGQFFDKTMLTSWAVKWGMRGYADLRFAKFIDPVMLARRHMRVSRRSLGNILQFLDIDEEKTSILWKHWMQATIEGNSRSLGYIVDHCVIDVIALEKAYDKMRKLVKGIDERGSAA